MQRRYIRMAQPRLDFDLAHEAFRQFGGVDQIGQDDLHSFDPIRDEVLDFIDRAHAARADQVNNTVFANGLAYRHSHETLRISAMWSISDRMVHPA